MNPFELINYALEIAPHDIAVLPVTDPEHPERQLLQKSSLKVRPIPPALRQAFADGNGHGSPPTEIETGRMLCILPSDVVKNLRGPADQRDVMLLFLFRRRTYELAKSGLILPQSAGARIVVPGVG